MRIRYQKKFPWCFVTLSGSPLPHFWNCKRELRYATSTLDTNFITVANKKHLGKNNKSVFSPAGIQMASYIKKAFDTVKQFLQPTSERTQRHVAKYITGF